MGYHQKKQSVKYCSSRRREVEGGRKFKEVMVENFLSLQRDLDIQVSEAHRSPNKLNLKSSSQRQIIMKVSRIKDKERFLKVTRRKMLFTYK